jgi:hypothetical protein
VARARLDLEILEKLARKTNATVKSVRERVSREASRRGICSEAMLLVLAAEHGIGYQRALRKLDSSSQAQVRSALGGRAAGEARRAAERVEGQQRGADWVGEAIDALLTDPELRNRCADLLRKRKYLDRAVREAATVLEDRLRQRSGLGKDKERTRRGMIARVLNPDPSKAIIKVSDDPDEQRGIFELCAGLVGGFGNALHHTLSEVGLGEALALCGVANVLLRLVEKGRVHDERVEKREEREGRAAVGGV